ncbi:MAG: ComEC/Rec2 family competence protein [Bacteroidota bacterium]
MHTYRIPIWKQAPLIRIVLSMITGILMQFYFSVPIKIILSFLLLSFILFLIFYYLPIRVRFKFQFAQSALLIIIVSSFAMLLTWNNDWRNKSEWFGKKYNTNDLLLLKIEEPLTEKKQSFTTIASVKAIVRSGKRINVKGKLNLIFRKENNKISIHYGDLILIKKNIQLIKNSGNPGAFDNKRYQAFQQIYHQVYLNEKDFTDLKINESNTFKRVIFSLKEKTLDVLKKNISVKDGLLGISEALLIGYKNDLDKDIVSAYSKTGVVHIIAISGLHLGLIYMLLLWILQRMPFIKRNKIIKAFILIICLWVFSLMTGASASVLRSAVMFTCIITGETINRKSSISNSLAASAFILLCYNPYFLWDVGFQLSYFAIIGIVWLQKPILHLFDFKKYLPLKIWEMAAITLAAQVITFPVCIYYFHQFPNYFLLSNLIAVPLSTIILFAEILMIALSSFNLLASYIGKFTEQLISIMNEWILFISKLPFSITENIYADLQTTIILYVLVILLSIALVKKNKLYFKWTLLFIILFTATHTIAAFKLNHQKKIIVYNIPHYRAIDFIRGNEYYFHGDHYLQQSPDLNRFYLIPTRNSIGVNKANNKLPGLGNNNLILSFYNTKIVIVDSTTQLNSDTVNYNTDIAILSNNPKININTIAQKFHPHCIIFDASNSLWKIEKLKKECEALNLPCFSIVEQGAFVLNIH